MITLVMSNGKRINTESVDIVAVEMALAGQRIPEIRPMGGSNEIDLMRSCLRIEEAGTGRLASIPLLSIEYVIESA